MKPNNLFRFALTAVLASVLLLGCKSAIEALKMSTSVLGKNKKTEQVEPQKFYNVEHNSHSDLPTIIDFLPDADLNKENFPAWVEKEMKVDIRFDRSIESEEGQIHHYNQYYNEIPVFGASYKLITSEDKPISAHGQLYSGIKIKSEKKISQDEILKSVRLKFPELWIRKSNK